MVRPQRRNEFDGLKRGSWSPEEDQKLSAYINEHGHGNWRALPEKAGLQRCGKSCRLRWNNYLRPDIKRGNFSLKEDQTIIQMHALLGNKWSIIANYLPKRTDNEIKNYWNTHLTRRLNRMGIDPMTHKPKTDVFGSSNGQSATDIILSHTAQWESTRLEAEARFSRQSKLILNPLRNQLNSSSLSSKLNSKITTPPADRPQCLDVLKASERMLFDTFSVANNCLPSPTSTLNFQENMSSIPIVGVLEKASPKLDFAANNATYNHGGTTKDIGNDLKSLETLKQVAQQKERLDSLMAFHEMTASTCCFDDKNVAGSLFSIGATKENAVVENMSTEALSNILDDKYNDQNIAVIGENTDGSCRDQDIHEQDMDYWNTILKMVDSFQSDSSLLF